MPAPDLRLIADLEARAFNAWPARQSVRQGGWQFRLSGGFTKRANSANAVAPGAPLEGLQQAAEAFYAHHGLPAVFRLSPLAPPQADLALAAAGYLHHDPSLVLRASLAQAAAHADVEVASTPSSAWLDGLAAANQVAAHHHATHHAMVRAIAPPCGFATVRVEGEPVAYGLGVLERGAVGLFDLVVAPRHRGQGHGRRLVGALLDWGQRAGGDWAYLQVTERNTVAQALYASMGFVPCYGYHYRVPAGPA